MLITSLSISLLAINKLVSDSEREDAQNRILRIEEELNSRTENMGALAPIDEIDRRIKLTINDGALYSVKRKDGRIVTGNIDKWPLVRNRGVMIDVTINDRPYVAMRKSFGSDFELLIAQSLNRQIYIKDRIIFLFISALVINFILGLILFKITKSKSDKLLNSLSDALEQASIGSIYNRIPEYEDPMYRHIANQINMLLTNIEYSHDTLRQIGGNMAHELIEPLARVQDRIDALSVEYPQIIELEQIIDELDSLQDTYRGLLSLAEIEAGREYSENFQYFDLSDAARDTCDLYSDNLRESHINLICKYQIAPIYGDPWLIRSAIGNIMSNAIKHSPKHGDIYVSTDRLGSKCRISVKDEGPGLSGKTPTQLFAELRGLNKMTNVKHGLGLRIVNSIAIRHNAKLLFEEDNLGLSVCIEFPCK